MQAQATSDRVEQPRVLDGNGDDVGDVELEEEEVIEDAVDVGVADEDEDEERQGDEVEQRRDNGRVAPGVGAGHGGLLGFVSIQQLMLAFCSRYRSGRYASSSGDPTLVGGRTREVERCVCTAEGKTGRFDSVGRWGRNEPLELC